MSVGIQPTFNKFASLHVQDSDSDSQTNLCNSKQKNKTATKNSAVNNAKKRVRRRKKKENGDNQTIDNLVHENKSTSGSISGITCNVSNDWLRRDEDLVEQVFHDDMWKAIELSKQEYEKEMQKTSNVAVLQGTAHSTSQIVDSPVADSHGEGISKKTERDIRREKKHKEKAAKTVSLEKFHQQVEDILSLKSDPTPEEESSPLYKSYKPSTKTPAAGDFFDGIDKELSRVQHQDHHKPVVTTPESMETALLNERLMEQLLQKDNEIIELSNEAKSWKDKYLHVKKRNQQLLVMLQQGEMKDKAEILLDVERLSIIRDELTGQVTELHQSLEKERSKVSKLKDELKAVSKSVKK